MQRVVLSVTLILLGWLLACPVVANPTGDLHRSVSELSAVRLDTAKVDNLALQAWDLAREKWALPALKPSTSLPLPGYDVSALASFIQRLGRNPQPGDPETARILVEAISDLRQLQQCSWLLSDQVTLSAWHLTAAAFSFASRLHRVQPALAPARVQEKIRHLVRSLLKTSVSYLAAFLPPDTRRHLPLVLWLGEGIHSLALGRSVSLPSGGMKDAALLTLGRVVLGHAREIGYLARSQPTIRSLGEAALAGRLVRPQPAERQRLLARVQTRVNDSCRAAALERNGARTVAQLGEMASLLALLDPGRVTHMAATAAGAIAAGGRIHAFLAPLACFCNLDRDRESLLHLYTGRPPTGPAPVMVALAPEKQRENDERMKKLAELTRRYAETAAEFAALGDQSTGQREFFEKLKELERLDREISRLSLTQ